MAALTRDVRRVLEPNTGSRIRVSFRLVRMGCWGRRVGRRVLRMEWGACASVAWTGRGLARGVRSCCSSSISWRFCSSWRALRGQMNGEQCRAHFVLGGRSSSAFGSVSSVSLSGAYREGGRAAKKSPVRAHNKRGVLSVCYLRGNRVEGLAGASTWCRTKGMRR